MKKLLSDFDLLINSLASNEAHTFLDLVTKKKNLAALEFVQKRDLSEFDRGLIAGQIEIIDYICGMIQNSKKFSEEVQEKRNEEKSQYDFDLFFDKNKEILFNKANSLTS